MSNAKRTRKPKKRTTKQAKAMTPSGFYRQLEFLEAQIVEAYQDKPPVVTFEPKPRDPSKPHFCTWHCCQGKASVAGGLCESHTKTAKALGLA